MADIKKAYTLFVDEARAVQFLNDYQNEFLFNEDEEHEEDEAQDSKMETS